MVILKEMTIYKTQYWQVNIPTLWDAEFDDDADVIYDKKGVGELVVSTLYEEDGVSDEQIEAMVEEHADADAIIEDVELGDFGGIMLSYTKEGEFWCEWYLRGENVLLFASYNCDEANAEEDEDVVESILESLEEIS